MNLNALYQFNGLGHQLDNAEAVMTGAGLLAINPLTSRKNAAAGSDTQAQSLQGLQHSGRSA